MAAVAAAAISAPMIPAAISAPAVHPRPHQDGRSQPVLATAIWMTTSHSERPLNEPGAVAECAPAIPLHAFAAMSAFALGLVQFAAPKGTLSHRAIGWTWVLLMTGVAVSSFWILEIRLVRSWSPIHLLSLFTLAVLPFAVWRAHTHRVADHRRIMISIFAGALVVAGLFTLLPGGSCIRYCSGRSPI